MKNNFKKFYLFLINIFLSITVFATVVPNGNGFVKNNGQVADQNGNLLSQLSYYASHSGYNVFFSSNFIQYDLNKYKKIPNPFPDNNAPDSITVIDSIMPLQQVFFGANNNPVIQNNGLKDLKYNFYLPHCSAGVTNVPSYSELVYQSIYPNIDLRYYFDGNSMKYEFIVYPGGNPNAIQFQYKGATNTFVDVNGKLNVATPYGTLIEQAPYISQNGIPVSGSFSVSGDTASFLISGYNNTDTLIIDPLVDWTSFFGGSSWELIKSIRTRSDQGIEYFYGTGTTASAPWLAILPLYLGGQYSAPNLSDGFLYKINSNGSTFGNCWVTYFGGENGESVEGMAVDANNNEAVCGYTNSEFSIGQNPNGGGVVYMPDHASMNPCFMNYDGFVMTFDDNGIKEWGTYYGGDLYDFLYDIEYDNAGNIYVGGGSNSDNQISTATAIGGATHQLNKFNAPVGCAADGDGVLASFTNLGAIRWGTFFGGEAIDRFLDICINNGHLYAGGLTTSDQNIVFANPGVTAHAPSDIDGYIVDFTLNGNYVNSTYYGGTDQDEIWALAADDFNVYVTGLTFSTLINYDYPGGLTNQPFAFDNSNCEHVHQIVLGGVRDAFITSIPVTFNNINWCTYYGGSQIEGFYDMDINCNYLLVGGLTTSANNINYPSPFTPVIQPAMVAGGFNGSIATFKKGTGAIYYGTYYGGVGQVNAVRFSGRTSMYAAGQALQNPWVTQDNFGNALLNQNGGGFTQFQPQPTPGIGGDAMMMRCDDFGIFEQFCSTCYTNQPITILNAGTTYTNINLVNQTIQLVGAGNIMIAGLNNLISGCEVICDQDSRLLVNPNALITINNNGNYNTYFHACNGENWKGIFQQYVLGSTGKITINGLNRSNQVRIEDAVIGLHIKNGAPFVSEYVHYNRNLTGISVEDDLYATYVANNYDCAIDGCSFTCTSDLNCAFGVGVIRGNHGILAVNLNTPPSTNGIFIGESTIDPSLMNDFSDTERGIELQNSNALILNNQFSNFFTNQTTGQSYNEGVAIRIIPNSTNDPVRVDVGTPSAPVTSAFYNIFKDCFRGIVMGNFISSPPANNNGLKVHYNQFSNIHGLTTNTQNGTSFLSDGPNAIEVIAGTGNTYDITHNEYNEIDFGGINLHDLSFCSAEIHFNIFNNSQTAGVNNKSEAIHVYSVAIINLQTKITNNRITNFRFGINCSGLKSPQIIRNSPIDFFRAPGITNANGIRLTNTSFATVERNFTTRVSGTPNAVGPCGIYIENCDNAYFNHNVTDQGRYGFYFNNLSSNFNMVCNSFNNHLGGGAFPGGAGVFFNNCNPTGAIIASSLGLPYAASGNQWSNCVPSHLDGGTGANSSNLVLVNWHWDNMAGIQYNPNPTGLVFPTQFPSSLPDNCYNLIVPPIVEYDSTDEDLREKMIGVVVGDTTGENGNYELPNDEETMYRITERAFRDLFFGKIPLYMGASSDPLYVSFFDSLMNTNISKIAMVDSALKTGDTISAEQFNNQITSANLNEGYKKIVNGIFIAKLKSHADSLTTEQFNTLLAIATQPAWLSDAIYQAREMLNVTVDEEDYSYREEGNNSTANNLIVQPNPADKMATVLLSLHKTKSGSLTITNTSGKIIYNKKISSSDIVINLSTATWAQGVYFVKFDADGISSNGKLIIVH